ncbi:MAG: hypothetical protein H6604_04810 [Flavobacteriales bacterium]|nr:hypothetical protein [Flavobacteriales bacterium]
MENTQKLILEINKIGEELAKIESPTGLLMQQNRIQELYEKFIYFKVSQENIGRISEKPKEKEIKIEQEKPINKEIPIKVEEKIEEIPAKKIEEEVKTESIIENDIKEKPIHIVESSKNLTNIQLSLNDRIAFITKLFNGESEKCTAAIEAFNKLKTKNDSMVLFNELSAKFDWNGKEEFSDRLKELIDNRFN